jgi:hypothetical protein
MKSDWWPQITVDVLESDLAVFFGNQKRIPIIRDEDEIECDWEIVESDDFEMAETKYDSLRKLDDQFKSQRGRIVQLQFSMCCGTFSMLMADAELGNASVDRFSPLNFCFSATESASIVALDVSMAVKSHVADFLSDSSAFLMQDTKDIQRDSVCLNGRIFVGSECGGYQTILDAVVGCIGAAGLHKDDEWEDIETLGQVILSLANRTFSGGIAFEKILGISKGLVSPLSIHAQPLDIIVTKSAAFVRAHTRYGESDDVELEPTKFFDAQLFVEIPLVAMKQNSRAHLFIEIS